MALGTATIMVSREKSMRAKPLRPLVNMWWAHTKLPTPAMDMELKAIAL